jgi:hypothetical protein
MVHQGKKRIYKRIAIMNECMTTLQGTASGRRCIEDFLTFFLNFKKKGDPPNPP